MRAKDSRLSGHWAAALYIGFAVLRLAAQAQADWTPIDAAAMVRSVDVELISPNNVRPNEPARYLIRVRNLAALTSNSMEVEAKLPVHLDPVDGSHDATRTGRTLAWKIGPLESGGGIDLTFQAVAKQVPIGVVQVSAKVPGNAAVKPASAAPRLEVEVTGPTSSLVGSLIEAKVTIANRGDAVLKNGGLQLRLSNGLRLTAAPATPRKAFELAPAQSLQIPLRLEVVRSGAQGVFATVEADGGLKQSAELRLLARQPGLRVEITGPKDRLVGQFAEYQITVSNPGDAPVTGVLVFFELTKESSVRGAEAGGVFDPEQNLVYWPVRTLAPAGKRTLRISLRVDKPASSQFRASAKDDGKLDAEAYQTTTFKAANP